jgi:membrane protein implicated in regulation of membrane protease activity
MRIVNALISALLTAVAVIAAVTVALIAAATGLALYLVRRFRRGSTPTQHVRANRARRPTYDEGEIIDISATEVSAAPPSSK